VRVAAYDPRMDVELVRRQAADLLARGSDGEGLALLEGAADAASAGTPGDAAMLLVDAVPIALGVAGPGRAVAIAARAAELAAGTGGAERVITLLRLGDALSWAGRYAEATELWRRASIDPGDADPRLLAERANALIRLGDPGAHDGAYRALVGARAAGRREMVLDALNLVTVAEVHAGRLQEARRSAEEALRLVEGEGSIAELEGAGLLAWPLALVGDEPALLEVLALAERRRDELRITSPGGLARGLLALSKGAAAAAVGAFESKLAEARWGPVAALTAYRPFAADLVEAYARADRSEDARRILSAVAPVAMGSGQARLAAPTWRGLGIVNEDSAAFERALEAHGAWGNRFEEARTRLAFGEVLRRQRRRADARGHLAAAAAAFEQVGARIWLGRAVAELRLAGERTPAPGPRRTPGPEQLTRQEGEILDLVRAGLSNRAIAERLVLSVKTVEGHLTTIYGKFGVTSRTQIVAALARSDADPG
jgi:DNA-binding CsgD family transcriptional regulator